MTVFQPHRYSRTLQCYDGFVNAFGETDILLMTDLYAAGEDPLSGVSAESLARDISKGPSPPGEVRFVGDLKSAGRAAQALFQSGDLLLCLGAGSISKLADDLKSHYER